MTDYYAYLKIQKHSGSSSQIDTIPLRVESAQFGVDKSIPNFPIPLSGLVTGESSTVALDLGMSSKRIDLTGVIMGHPHTIIRRTHTKDSGGSPIELKFTAHEIAQLIASGVDSTGLASYQAINELVLLMPSGVDENYANRTTNENIPFSFRARGSALQKDNRNVAFPLDFPTASSHSDFAGYQGMLGFISSFGFTFSGETLEIPFNLSFTVASVIP